MTIAYDLKTGRLLGQVLDRPPSDMLLLLTRSGYFSVPATTVRVEVLR